MTGEERFVRGDRVELVEVDDGYARFGLAPGMRGTVMVCDSLGTVHVAWDFGVRVGIISELAHFVRLIEDSPETGITGS